MFYQLFSTRVFGASPQFSCVLFYIWLLLCSFIPIHRSDLLCDLKSEMKCTRFQELLNLKPKQKNEIE